MKRTLAVLALAGGTAVLLAAPAAAQPISEPASCQGYLSSYANPNMGFIVHELVMPTAADLGVPVGKVFVANATVHNGGIEACIP
jgi:hypothetical protein